MTYSIRFFNGITKKVYCVLEMERERFTKRDYDKIISMLFREARDSYLNTHLFADVYCCKEEELSNIEIDTLGVITVTCWTVVDGSTIDAHIYVNSEPVRKMNIAC